jgi:ABC-type polysaccharide/polyol phosphate transport system ATPase subunit
MPSKDVVISFRDVTKTYRIFRHTGERLKQALSFGFLNYHKEFTALNNISFDVRKGETIGIIGRNGAGKSTLLQLICGILKPSSGTIRVNGRISAMLELGAGFNPEFTGRENAYFQGSLMGYTEPQMQDRFDQIESFADIGEFIDQPVRTYSSGMLVRLAFAVATHVAPDILITDEILAVGDASFQQKCIDHIAKMQSSGTTIVVVSHDPYHIERMCNTAAVLRQGQLSEFQPARNILMSYHEMVQDELALSPDIALSCREGTQEVSFERVFLESSSGTEINNVMSAEPLRIVADIVAIEPIDSVHFCFEIYSSTNELVTVIATLGLTETTCFHGKHRITFSMHHCQLTSGWYYITAIAGHKIARLDTWQRAVDFKVIMKDKEIQNVSMDRGVFTSRGQWEFSKQQNESVY